MASSTSVVIALTWGGIQFPWTSVQVLAPLVLGLVGVGAWFVYEGSVATHPIVGPANPLDDVILKVVCVGALPIVIQQD